MASSFAGAIHACRASVIPIAALTGEPDHVQPRDRGPDRQHARQRAEDHPVLGREGCRFWKRDPYVHPQNGQIYNEFRLDFRNTMVVVSRLFARAARQDHRSLAAARSRAPDL